MGRKHLPSKKFIHSVIAITACGTIVFLITNLFSSKSYFFSSKKDGKIQTEKLTINELVQKDTDGDEIADWEEALWGTDKNNKITFDNLPDPVYIENKKKELGVDESVNEEGLTETEKFAREFFATYVAMKESGNIDQNTINNFSSALGQKIINPTMLDIYSEKEIKITEEDNKETGDAYYQKVKELFDSYRTQGIGEELNILSNELTENSTTVSKESNNQLIKISEAYKDFAKNVIETEVPKSLATYHLKIANSSNNLGISIFDMTKVKNDQIVGLSGISKYQEYSNELLNAVEELEAFLKE
jgi:hypothetical protein